MIDTHAHLDEVENVEDAIERGRQAGLIAIIALGQSYESNQKVLELAVRHKGFVFPALGLHPWEISKELPSLDRSLSLIEDNLSSAVALGEVGLDYDKRARALAGKEVQQSVLRDLLTLANKFSKPVSMHSRYATNDCLAIVAGAGLTRVVFHWFTGSSGSLEALVKAGHSISATPAAEYHLDHRRAIQDVPMGQLLLETDCPVEYGREVRYRAGPEHLVRSLNAVAGIRSLDSAVVARVTTRNARALFNIG